MATIRGFHRLGLGLTWNRVRLHLIQRTRPSIVLSRQCTTEEKVTHTGQAFEESDVRRARFISREKMVNENFAIDMIADEPPTEVDARHVWCNGGGGPLGHPKVYINLDPEGPHSCGYCGLRFVKKPH
ncbi:NADH dehydrogenase [ubiquinone] iron-sulfur protein 6, mitochondrial-like [Anneissia japonica]|uniref:NADH dehydrogenase [ubiquinone] iron-sulfur protein 6, mitochondrial-like n=1 Tax=Anneissia japonica TaxID=1529436 RepID=UPI0014259E2A|nr:NADH dehydrogenase [ubiquinone] iron-sulfur protein 6, mitochondrial-like [Anneissia japonica]